MSKPHCCWEPRWLVVENDTQHQWNVVKLWEKPIGCRISMKFPAFEFWETRIKQEWNEHGTRYYVIPFGIHAGNKHLKIYCGRPENTTKISEAMALTAWCRSRLTSASMAIYCYVSIHPIPFSGIPFSGVFSHSFRLITWSNPKHVDDISDYQWYPSDSKIMNASSPMPVTGFDPSPSHYVHTSVSQYHILIKDSNFSKRNASPGQPCVQVKSLAGVTLPASGAVKEATP